MPTPTLTRTTLVLLHTPHRTHRTHSTHTPTLPLTHSTQPAPSHHTNARAPHLPFSLCWAPDPFRHPFRRRNRRNIPTSIKRNPVAPLDPTTASNHYITHHSTTPSIHHSNTPSLHQSITPSIHQSPIHSPTTPNERHVSNHPPHHLPLLPADPRAARALAQNRPHPLRDPRLGRLQILQPEHPGLHSPRRPLPRARRQRARCLDRKVLPLLGPAHVHGVRRAERHLCFELHRLRRQLHPIPHQHRLLLQIGTCHGTDRRVGRSRTPPPRKYFFYIILF